MSKNKSLNVGDVLNRLDRNDYGLYDSLDDQGKKELSPWVLMRFLSSCEKNPEIYLLSVNECVNVGFAMLSQHKKLLSLLLATCGVGSRQTHKWIAPPKGTKKSGSMLLSTLKELLPCKNIQELAIIAKTNSNDEIKEYLTVCGVNEDRIKAIFDEL